MKVYYIECVPTEDGIEVTHPFDNLRTFTTLCAATNERAKEQAMLLLQLANQINDAYDKAYVYTEEGRGWSGIVKLDY